MFNFPLVPSTTLIGFAPIKNMTSFSPEVSYLLTDLAKHSPNRRTLCKGKWRTCWEPLHQRSQPFVLPWSCCPGHQLLGQEQLCSFRKGSATSSSHIRKGFREPRKEFRQYASSENLPKKKSDWHPICLKTQTKPALLIGYLWPKGYL